MKVSIELFCQQSLQTEYDKAVDELEAERKLNRELQKKVTQTVDQVAEMELKSSQLEDDKRQLISKVNTNNFMMTTLIVYEHHE